MSELANCPFCGSGKRGLGYDAPVMHNFHCGTWVFDDESRTQQTETCLRNQLTQRTAEPDALQAKYERAVQLFARLQHRNPVNPEFARKVERCICCGRAKYYGCFSDCELAAILSESETP